MDSPDERLPDATRPLTYSLSARAAALLPHARSAFRLAYRILHDLHAAEDACQQAFSRACETTSGPQDPAAIRGWLTRIVINEALMVLRRRRTESSALQWARPPAEVLEPGDLLDRHEVPALRGQVLDALAALPDQTRVVVILRVIEGLSGNEVRQILGCSASEVSRRLYDGMERLRMSLGAPKNQEARASHDS